MADDDVLNLARLEEAYENDSAAIANLLTLARETERRYIRALRDAIAADDIVAVASAAHSIKGSASNIGANVVSRVAAQIEDRARVKDWTDIPAIADELDTVYGQMCDRIAAYAAKIA